MLDEVGAVAWQHINDGNLNHGVAARLQTHRSTSHINQYLTRQGGVVNLHVEFQTLVLGLTADALADEVHTVTHIAYVVNALYLEHMRLIVGKIWIGLDVLRHLL